MFKALCSYNFSAWTVVGQCAEVKYSRVGMVHKIDSSYHVFVVLVFGLVLCALLFLTPKNTIYPNNWPLSAFFYQLPHAQSCKTWINEAFFYCQHINSHLSRLGSGKKDKHIHDSFICSRLLWLQLLLKSLFWKKSPEGSEKSSNITPKLQSWQHSVTVLYTTFLPLFAAKVLPCSRMIQCHRHIFQLWLFVFYAPMYITHIPPSTSVLLYSTASCVWLELQTCSKLGSKTKKIIHDFNRSEPSQINQMVLIFSETVPSLVHTVYLQTQNFSMIQMLFPFKFPG